MEIRSFLGDGLFTSDTDNPVSGNVLALNMMCFADVSMTGLVESVSAPLPKFWIRVEQNLL